MKKRTFIAINLPKEVKDELAKLITQAKKFNSSRALRYVKPQGIHITLHFLGLLDESQITEVKKILKAVAPQYSAAMIETDGINGFPHLNQPRVIILKAQQIQGDSLKNLQIELGQKLQSLDIFIDQRKWSPHLTLARVKGQCQFTAENLTVPKLTIPIKSIELISSKLTPSGAEYQVISSHYLK